MSNCYSIRIVARQGVTLAESEVGTGKTHAYLIAAALIKRGRMNDDSLRGRNIRQSWADSAHMPVVVATSSIALQNAIMKDYIPEISCILIKHEVIRSPLVASIRKGKEHYICERKLFAFYNESHDLMRKLLDPFVGTTAPFDLTDADTLSPYIRRRICVSGGCGKSCHHINHCRYQKHLAFAEDPGIDFLITNHNYFLADRHHRATGKKPLLRHYQLVVIDEGHKLLAAARSMYGLEFTSAEIPELAREVHIFAVDKSRGGVNLHRLAKKLTEQSGKLFRRLKGNIPASDEDDEAERFTAIMDDEAARYLRNISRIAVGLAEACADSYVQAHNAERRDKAVWRLNSLSECLDGLLQQRRLIHWLEKRTEGAKKTDALCAVPKDLNELLHQDLWSDGIPIILTSGTLSAGGDFTRTKETLGLNRLPFHKLYETSMPSPFDYNRNSMIYISENIPFPDAKNPDYIAAIALEIESLTLASHGHAAVLFTSYKVMAKVYAILKNRKLPFPLFTLGRGGTQAIERFKKSGNGILLAAGALWEGIDIPGNTLSMLIIVKLPFAVPDPIGDYERSLCGGMERYRETALIPDMLVKNKQGYGRLIRTEKDTGCVAFLDARLREGKPLRERVLRSLPLCQVTSSIKTISSF